MNKKIRSNRFKPETTVDGGLQTDTGIGIDFCLKCIMTIAFVSILSLSLIFAYDFITQSEIFNIKKIEISGTKRVLNNEIIELAKLSDKKNILGINLYSIENRIASHPWIQSATVKRTVSCMLYISVVEHKPLAIIKIENLADILINTQGQPFKEYDSKQDHIENLPVISGVDLTLKNNQYLFDGPLFNSILDFIKLDISNNTGQITGDKHTGISIESKDIYAPFSSDDITTVNIKLGFTDFEAKLLKAKKIREYIDKNFQEKIICAMDLINIEKVFIKTKFNDALHHNLKKGV